MISLLLVLISGCDKRLNDAACATRSVESSIRSRLSLPFAISCVYLTSTGAEHEVVREGACSADVRLPFSFALTTTSYPARPLSSACTLYSSAPIIPHAS